jgi:O-glycosyl hydrolase
VFPSISQYYGPKGIGYDFVRIAIAGTDFSTRFYTYNDGPADFTLSRFELAVEDYKYKVRTYISAVYVIRNLHIISINVQQFNNSV